MLTPEEVLNGRPFSNYIHNPVFPEQSVPMNRPNVSGYSYNTSAYSLSSGPMHKSCVYCSLPRFNTHATMPFFLKRKKKKRKKEEKESSTHLQNSCWALISRGCTFLGAYTYF